MKIRHILLLTVCLYKSVSYQEAQELKIFKEEYKTCSNRGYCASQSSFYGYKLDAVYSFDAVFIA